MISMRFAAGAVAGAIGMYLLDPSQGRTRRKQTAAQLRSRCRRAAHDTERRLRDRQHRRHGEEVELLGAGRFRPVDDRSLATHLHQVLAELDVPTADVTVEVVDGTVRLRGQLPTSADIQRVLKAVAAEPGVERVQHFLHLPGEAAPNKLAALAASRSNSS